MHTRCHIDHDKLLQQVNDYEKSINQLKLQIASAKIKYLETHELIRTSNILSMIKMSHIWSSIQFDSCTTSYDIMKDVGDFDNGIILHLTFRLYIDKDCNEDKWLCLNMKHVIKVMPEHTNTGYCILVTTNLPDICNIGLPNNNIIIKRNNIVLDEHNQQTNIFRIPYTNSDALISFKKDGIIKIFAKIK